MKGPSGSDNMEAVPKRTNLPDALKQRNTKLQIPQLVGLQYQSLFDYDLPFTLLRCLLYLF